MNSRMKHKYEFKKMKKGSEKTDTDSGVVNSDACGKNASGKITVSKFARGAEK